jgi:hypothetical protein
MFLNFMRGADMPNQKAGLLNSWKEIANYLGRGVRTVQRWEKIGLPVRRLGAGSRAPVIGYANDIDQWMQRAGAQGLPASASAEHRGDLHESILRARELREQMVELRLSQRVVMKKLIRNIAALEDACGQQILSSEIPFIPTGHEAEFATDRFLDRTRRLVA